MDGKLNDLKRLESVLEGIDIPSIPDHLDSSDLVIEKIKKLEESSDKEL